MDSLYDVCFAGQLLDGQELQNVRPKIQKLFNANAETLDKLFSGKTLFVKRGCDELTAAKYKQAMKKAGAVAIIRACQTAPTPSSESAASSTQDADLDLAPVGADVLRPEERAAPATSDVDISGISLSQVGTDLSEQHQSTAAAPDTSHLSMGEVGEELPGLEDTSTPVAPDIDDIALSPQGTDFSDCAPPPADAPALDLSQIKMAPAGSDVLEEQYKKHDKSKGPDTGHLSIVEE